MEGKIKTALEMAMERMKSFKEVEPEEIEKLEYIPRGKGLGAAFLKDVNFTLDSALAEYDGNKRKFIIAGFEEALLSNLVLPLNDETMEGNRRSFEGIIGIKSNKREITAFLNELEYLFNQYRQALEQAKETLRQEMAVNARMGHHRQGAHPGAGYEERQMGYREEWARVQSQLNQRYEVALAEAKNKIKSIK
ncbi:hypothetical protein DCCM_3698 [Desulfocucumis palustris]|uniref:Uncharacterized protein n=1 Tax=Desulfocucumis palustris TaxID=1898651 RepID=A0A2L2XDY9_9FIRM|nr:hypothetical protein [Desulfocucumis palustris]GBF34579.1 hypothetical protein DCCM_3698 [Desulfocucumis palustris]